MTEHSTRKIIGLPCRRMSRVRALDRVRLQLGLGFRVRVHLSLRISEPISRLVQPINGGHLGSLSTEIYQVTVLRYRVRA